MEAQEGEGRVWVAGFEGIGLSVRGAETHWRDERRGGEWTGRLLPGTLPYGLPPAGLPLPATLDGGTGTTMPLLPAVE